MENKRERMDSDAVKQMAKAKLEKELKSAKEKDFAEPVIGYLIERCNDDLGLSQDVVQEHKAWKKCFDYIYEQARRQATGNRAVVRDDVVFEWAEDYFHKDDKAEEEEKAKKASERKKKQAKKTNSKKSFEDTATRQHKAEKKAEAGNIPKQGADMKPKKSSREIEGQLDLFSIMGA